MGDPAIERRDEGPRRRAMGPRAGVLVTLASLFVVELALRGAGWPRQLAVIAEDTQGWVALPNQTRVLLGERVTINAHGFRDDEWSPLTDGPPRVLVLGDSVAFGPGVAQRETFCELWQTALREGAPSAGVNEVQNASLQGYCFQQMAARYAALAPAWRPRTVLVCLNDQSHRPFQAVHRDGWIRRRLIGSALYEAWLVFTDFNSVRPAGRGPEAEALARLLEAVLRGPFGAESEPCLEEMRRGLLAIASQQAAAGGELLVLALPNAATLADPSRPTLGQLLGPWAREHDVSFIDAVAAYRRDHPRGDGRELFLEQDPEHLSLAGHRFIAALLMAE